MLEEKTRLEAIEKLKELYERGYRYVVRDKEMPYLVCFSLKPKRYRELYSWGYKDADIPKALPAYPIKNIDVKEISYNNKSAILIEDIIKK